MDALPAILPAVLPATLPIAVAEQLWNERQLAAEVRAPAWRLWRYREPAVVLGCSQRRLLAEADDTADDAAGAPVLLRQSGGGAVLTGPWMLGLSVALPAGHPQVDAGPVGSYRWLGEAIAQVLRAAGLAGAHAIPPERLRAQGEPCGVRWACFGGLSPWEVLAADGRKLVGLAQVRRRNGVLLVGGVLLDPSPWALLCRTLGVPAADGGRLARITTSCREQIGAGFDADAFERALESALCAALHERLAQEAGLH